LEVITIGWKCKAKIVHNNCGIFKGHSDMIDKQHPVKIFSYLILFVFAVELGIMFLFSYIENKNEQNWLESLADSTLLTILCVPFFWVVALRPLRMALQEVRLESAKLQKIVETAAEGIVSVDAAGNIQTFNNAAQRIFGYSEAEAIGNILTLLTPPSHREKHDDVLVRYLKTGKLETMDQIIEMKGLRKDGTTFPMEVMMTEVQLDDIRLFTAMIRDVSEQKITQQRIEHLAHYDSLTNLPNRSLFFDRLNQSIIAARRTQHSIALLFLDLDGFKIINDTLGHHFGDLLLVKVAERLSLGVRESDTLARLGGDEFTLILNDAHEYSDVAIVADKLIESIGEPFELDGHTVKIGVSIGIARYPRDADARATLIIVADRAMYAAKHAGKNTYRFGEPVGEATKAFPVFDPSI
jgi:diguanylate cyclase (GGDEF)-like protein/PAS domain S-box-containing protein